MNLDKAFSKFNRERFSHLGFSNEKHWVKWCNAGKIDISSSISVRIFPGLRYPNTRLSDGIHSLTKNHLEFFKDVKITDLILWMRTNHKQKIRYGISWYTNYPYFMDGEPYLIFRGYKTTSENDYIFHLFIDHGKFV